jgi:hypothetical protein
MDKSHAFRSPFSGPGPRAKGRNALAVGRHSGWFGSPELSVGEALASVARVVRLGGVPLALCLACSGGQTGDLSGRNGDGGGEGNSSGQCEEILHPLGALDEATSLGFTAEQMLEFAAGEFHMPIVWQESTAVEFGPESGTGELTLNVAYDGGSAYFVESRPRDTGQEDGPGLALGSACRDSVRVEVTVSATTAGGALSETFTAKLDAASRFSATFSKELDPAALSGSFEISAVNPAEGQVKQFGMNATLTPFGVTGTLTSIVEVHYPGPNGGAVGAMGVTYATFPGSVACAGDGGDGTGFALPVGDQVAGFSGAQAIEQWSSATPVAVTWLDGSSTELTLAATSSGDGCARLGEWFSDEPFRVSYPVQIAASSADGKLDGAYAGEIIVLADAEGNAGTILGTAVLPLTLAQVAQSGFSNAGDVSAYHRLALWLQSELVTPEFSGFLVLNGLVDPPCLTNPPEPDPGGMGSPGCSGTEVTPIERAEWGDLDN